MASNRWVAIDPDILTHPLVGAAQPVRPADPSRGAYSKMEAWLWLICNASFADHTVFNRGRKMTLQRGDLLGGWRFLAHTWNWSSKTVRSWVDRLMADNMLGKRAVEMQTEHNGGHEKEGTQHGNYYGNQAQILTVVNYWRFQFERYEKGQPNGQAEGQPKGNQRATKGQHITKETKEQQSSPNGEGAKAPAAQSLRAVIWDQGLAYLRSVYKDAVSEADLRSRLGKLIKEYTVGRVLSALDEAQRHQPIDPLDYVQGILRRPVASPSGGSRYSPDPVSEERRALDGI